MAAGSAAAVELDFFQMEKETTSTKPQPKKLFHRGASFRGSYLPSTTSTTLLFNLVFLLWNRRGCMYVCMHARHLFIDYLYYVSAADIQSVISKLNPELLKAVIATGSVDQTSLPLKTSSFSVPSTPKHDENPFPSLHVYTPAFWYGIISISNKFRF